MGEFRVKLLLIIVVISIRMLFVGAQENEFVLHPDKLDSFYYRAALSALLKAKFKVLAKQVNDIDRIIYTECQREAQTIVQQAKCLIKLMDARDQQEKQNNAGPRFSFSFNEDNPLKVLLNAIMDTDWKTLGGLLKKPDFGLEQQKPNFKLRRKRSVENVISNEQVQSKEFKSLPKSIQNLRRIERYLRLAEYCREYADQLNSENTKSLEKFNFPTEFKAQPPTKFSAFETFQDFLQKEAPFERLSILSPRIMSLFPTSKASTNDWSRMFSPTLFSFQKEGAFSLPNIFNLVLSDQREIHAWLDLLLQWSGAAKTLDQMINTMRPEMMEVEQRLYPKIKQLEELDTKWQEFAAKQSAKQREEMNRNGYTFLDSKQADFLFDNVPEHVHYTSKQKEYMMEKKIRELAQLDEQMIREKTLKMKPRVRRQVPQMFQSPNQLFPHLSPLPDSLFYPPAPSFPQQFPLFGLQYPPTPFPREFIPPFNPITTPYIPPIANQFTTMYPPNVVTQLSPFTTYQPPILNQITTQLPPNVGTQSISAFTAPSVAQSLTTLAPPLTTTPPGIPGLKPPPDFNEFKKMLGLGDDISQSPDAENGEPKVVVLEPWAVQHRIGGFVILEGIVLSPHALTSELFSPELLTFHVLTPRAFVAAALSPMAIFARILSPSAFRAEVLSPQALSAYVLTPEAFLAEILSPKVFEVRVLSPKAFTLQVLSPLLGSPKVQSPESLGIIVLSPSILSPHIMSDGCLNVEILSPHLLSGHDEHEHGHNENHSGHKNHHHCCNKHLNRCCHQKLPKHEANSHFNQFVHSATAIKPPQSKLAKLSKNDQQTGRSPKLLAKPSLGKLSPPYAFWPRKPPAMVDTTKLMAPQQPRTNLNFNKMPVNRVLMSKQQN